LTNVDPELAELLALLSAREQFDELGKLFDQTLRPWSEYSEEERMWIAAKAASLSRKS
jgi:hypothetical protein